VLSRLVADRLGRAARPAGGGGQPAGRGHQHRHERVARAAPDGYTLGLASIAANAANKWLYRSLPFDPDRTSRPSA
jgi:hypothetical protein